MPFRPLHLLATRILALLFHLVRIQLLVRPAWVVASRVKVPGARFEGPKLLVEGKGVFARKRLEEALDKVQVRRTGTSYKARWFEVTLRDKRMPDSLQ